MKKISFVSVCIVLVLSCSQPNASQQPVSDSTALKNDSSLSPTQISDLVTSSRAFEAVIWGIPAVNYDAMYQAAVRDAKAGINQLVYWSKPLDWKNQTLTPNADALYIMPFFNTKEVGPMVLEIPPAEGGHIVGTIMDCWQMALEDVGPAGVDKGKGGKYLMLPPNYKGKIPSGYIVLPCDTYEGFGLLRSIPKSGSGANLSSAVAYLKKIRFYALSEAAKSPETKFVDAYGILFDATIPYNMKFFESLNRIVQTQPWLDHDKVMIDQLQTIGIEKGRPFNPDAKMQALMQAALKEGHEWMTNYYETRFEPFFSSSRWFLPASPKLVQDVTEGFTDPDSYPTDVRGSLYSFVFTTVKHLGAGQFYLFVTRDAQGRPLDGGKNYRLSVPPKVPVHQYWSVTAYDFETHALIRDVPYASRSSLSEGFKANADSSTDIYFGPQAPAGRSPIGYRPGPVADLNLFSDCMDRINLFLRKHGFCQIWRR
jgi:hypothetical protein